MSSNPSARLNDIFQDASASGGGNDALRYTAPREPSAKQPQVQHAAPSPSSSVVYSTMVSLYRYDSTSRKYVQLGGATTGTKATVGCVIVGAETSYNLLFYNATKQHLCTVPVKFGVFKPILQAKSYVNFYDEQGVNWSVKFPSDTQVADFMRQIFLAKIHVEIWGNDKTVTKTNPNALIQDDLVFIKPEIPQVNNGDIVAVAFRAWRVVGNANSVPGDIITKYSPFEKASEGGLRKIRLGENSERIKALEEGIVGMKKGGKRIVLAPPGKTNGQDWYLLEIELLKTKTGTTPRKPVSGGTVPTEEKASRRRSSSKNDSTVNTVRASIRHQNDSSPNGDLVPYEDNLAAKNDMELKELRLLQREQQLELQARALERERMNVTGFGSMNLGTFPSSTMLNQALSSRPMDTLLAEINAKVDYLIRVAPQTSSSGIGAGPSDVAAVIRGVERLASENDRLLTQINSQHAHQSSYEKRCQELLEQNQRLQDEKRVLQERYQSAASAQLNAASELSALASARDAAVTQTNRLHAEYQQLLTAYYQLQQQGASEEDKQALGFEREARARAEKQLDKETQARALAEQELVLTKKQHDVALQLKMSELSTATAQFEQQKRSFEAKLEKLNQERMQLQHQAEEQAHETSRQLQTSSYELAQVQKEKEEVAGKLDVSLTRIHELETELASRKEEGESALALEEKQLLIEQNELLQQKIQDLEEEMVQLNQTLAEGAVGDQQEAAERALAAAEALKREAQELVTGAGERERLVNLFKESVNEMFFRFQDLFEEKTAVDGKQVLILIRKVLKTSTKTILEQLQEKTERESDVSDGPPAPPHETEEESREELTEGAVEEESSSDSDSR